MKGKRQKAKGKNESGMNLVATRSSRRASSCFAVFTFCLLPFAFCLWPSVTQAQYGRPQEGTMPRGGTPDVLKAVTIDQKLGAQIPLDTVFRDEAGRDVPLGEYFKKDKPVLLTLVYYQCPLLCSEVLNAQTGTLQAMNFLPGKEYEVVTVSFDARETPDMAARKKTEYLKRLGRPGAELGWHFLTGNQASIDRLAEATGFHYVWDDRSKQFAHASAIMIATPEGKLSHYFYGIEYAPKEMRLGLVEASKGKIGSPVDQLLLYCYHYDPTTGRFAPVMTVIRTAGVLTVLGVVALIVVLARRGSSNKSGGDSSGGNNWDESVNVGGTA